MLRQLLLFFCLLFPGVDDKTYRFIHSKQTFYHWAIPPSQESVTLPSKERCFEMTAIFRQQKIDVNYLLLGVLIPRPGIMEVLEFSIRTPDSGYPMDKEKGHSWFCTRPALAMDPLWLARLQSHFTTRLELQLVMFSRKKGTICSVTQCSFFTLINFKRRVRESLRISAYELK